MRAGFDRADRYRRAAGRAAELTTALRIARIRRLITDAEFAAVDAILDRVRGALWRLSTDGGRAHGPAGARPASR
jgi:hypothetical protein